jgi:hypothetical protein
VLQMQCELCLEASDAAQSLTTMRMFGIKFAAMHPQHADVRNAFSKTRTLEEWHAVLAGWYSP